MQPRKCEARIFVQAKGVGPAELGFHSEPTKIPLELIEIEAFGESVLVGIRLKTGQYCPIKDLDCF